VRFYFTGTEFLYDYNANLSKAVAAKRLPLTILCSILITHNKIIYNYNRENNAISNCYTKLTYLLNNYHPD